MRALRVDSTGGRAIVADIPQPVPGPGEVRLRVAAAGLNFADLLVMQGTYQVRAEPPLTLGMEAAGTVDAVGPGVTGIAPGARIAAFATTGALAEYMCVPARQVTLLPAALPFATAAAVQVGYGTAHLALTRRAGLLAGETLVVLGAAGGVGLTAVEIGKRLQARVIAVARGQARCEVARAAGADTCIDSDMPDLRGALREAGGADVVYDPVGGEMFLPALRALRPEGRYLAIGFASGTVPQAPANLLLVKNVSVIGFWWGGYLEFRPEVLADSLGTVFAWAAAGTIRPHVSHVLPLDRAAEGLALLRDRQATGKVVVTVQAE